MGKAKSRKGKLPKNIAGVKLPKKARRLVDRMIAELSQPIVREIIAGAVGMAAKALVKQASTMRFPQSGTQENKRDVGSAAKLPTAIEAKSAGKSCGDQFAEIAAGMAVAGLGKFMEKMQAASENRVADKKA